MALVALLSIGAVGAGAYEQTARARDEGTSVGSTAGQPGQDGELGTSGAGTADHAGRGHHGDGDRGSEPGSPDGQVPRTSGAGS